MNIICQLEPAEGPTTLCTSLFSFTWQLKTVLRQLHDHPSITKAASRLFHSIGISKHVNAAPYLQHKPCQLLQKVILRCSTHVCTSLAPRLMTEVFGLGTRLCVHMCTTLENGILHNSNRLELWTALLISLNYCDTEGTWTIRWINMSSG